MIDQETAYAAWVARERAEVLRDIGDGLDSLTYGGPRVERCTCGHFWFQGMECPHCDREVE